MVTITERIADVKISTESSDIYLKKGTARVILSNGKYVVIRRKDQNPTSLTPIFEIPKVSVLGEVRNVDGAVVPVSDLLDLLLKTADFYSN